MTKTLDFKPKFLSAIKHYDKKTFLADLMAGIIVGIVALPLAIAFGIASGVSPEKGIITAIVAGLMTPTGHHHQVHPLSHRRRIHQRYCRHHLHHADKRLAGHADGHRSYRLR